MVTHEHKIRVRYGETDQMGYVYYGNYALYYEIGRVELLRSFGITYKSMEEELNILLPVVSMQTRFIRPGRYDEELTIKTTLKKLPDRFIEFHVEIFNEQNKLINSGIVKLCFVDGKQQRIIYAPTYLMDKLNPYFE